MSLLKGLDAAAIAIESLSPWVRIVAIGTMVTVFTQFQLLSIVLELVRGMVWTPSRVMRHMRKQGHSGPAIQSVFGDNLVEMKQLAMTAPKDSLYGGVGSNMSHDWVRRVSTSYLTWTDKYGDKFIFKQGSNIHMHTADPDAIREVMNNKNLEYGKSTGTAVTLDLLGAHSMIFTDGEEWANQRRVVRSAFYVSRAKEMVVEMASWIENWIQKVEDQVKENGGPLDVEMSPLLDDLYKDILAHTSFGVGFEKGKKGFEHQERHRDLLLKRGVMWNPIRRLIPTALKKEIKKEQEEVFRCLREIIQDRRKTIQSGGPDCYGTDMLGLLLKDRDQQLAEKGRPSGEKEIWDDNVLDQCRTIFHAGHEAVHTSTSWALVMLAHYGEWQDRIRNEMKEVFPGQYPNADQLAKLKQLDMFINESLRLYGPVHHVERKVVKDNANLLGEKLPKDLVIFIHIVAMHHDKQVWGEDALEFKPERFANGITNACKTPHAYEPFGFGPRTCIAKMFGLVEMKLVVAMILRRFRIRLSSSYRHEPVYLMMIVPKNGIQLVLERLQR